MSALAAARALPVVAALLVVLSLAPAVALAASPEPVVGSGDARSDGGGPGIVGSPVAIAVGVVLLGVITAAGTLVVVRVTRGRDR